MILYNVVFAALTAWAPKADAAIVQETAEAIAEATESVGRGEQTALELAALAVTESRLAPWVARAQCNDPSWRRSAEGRDAMKVGDCDGGVAVSVFQIHPRRGGPTAKDLRDVKVAALFAARMWLVRPSAWTSWKIATRLAATWERP
jgi:hypothetical protein